jgi:formiminoglutamase
VIVGFPQDEGVRRNGGRVGAALAPNAIRRWLYRLVTTADLTALGLVDVGNLKVSSDLEASQGDLAEVIRDLLRQGTIPIVLGGGHETAFGVFRGYVLANYDVGIINLDAHLDVRPLIEGLGHSGSPFRQAMEYPDRPLPGSHYACLGAQPFSVSEAHLDYVRTRGGLVSWCSEVGGRLPERLRALIAQQAGIGAVIQFSLDADVVRSADVPGVSAPNPIGLSGEELIQTAALAGSMPRVASLELVEINPRFDVDDRSARWGALVIWHFLCGMTTRSRSR